MRVNDSKKKIMAILLEIILERMNRETYQETCTEAFLIIPELKTYIRNKQANKQIKQNAGVRFKDLNMEGT